MVRVLTKGSNDQEKTIKIIEGQVGSGNANHFFQHSEIYSAKRKAKFRKPGGSSKNILDKKKRIPKEPLFIYKTNLN